MADKVEIRVIELEEFEEIKDGMSVSSYEYTVQYRTGGSGGRWLSVPVTSIVNDRKKYERMKDGADD